MTAIQKWLWLVLFPFYFLSANEQPFVTCRLHGQLGNQLFEIVTTLAYAWDYDVQPIFPDLNRKDYNIPANREHVFFRLDASPLPRDAKKHIY